MIFIPEEVKVIFLFTAGVLSTSQPIVSMIPKLKKLQAFIVLLNHGSDLGKYKKLGFKVGKGCMQFKMKLVGGLVRSSRTAVMFIIDDEIRKSISEGGGKPISNDKKMNPPRPQTKKVQRCIKESILLLDDTSSTNDDDDDHDSTTTCVSDSEYSLEVYLIGPSKKDDYIIVGQGYVKPKFVDAKEKSTEVVLSKSFIGWKKDTLIQCSLSDKILWPTKSLMPVNKAKILKKGSSTEIAFVMVTSDEKRLYR
jgi:hypothetical protein